MGKVLWGSAATLLLALLVLAYALRSDHGSPPILLNPSEALIDEGVAMVMVCGDQPDRETVNQRAQALLTQGSVGRWTEHHRRNGCVVYYHSSNAD